MEASEITINDVGKVYDSDGSQPVIALKPVELTLRAGEFFSLVGPSGCGKTTLLNILAGLLKPSQGQVQIGPRVVSGPDPTVGIVFQKPTLLRWLTVEQNILLPSKVAGTLDDGTRQRCQDLLHTAGLAGFENHYPTQLSGGMQQRASIVRALVGEPQVLLMDEPFSALDEFTREKLQDELLNLLSLQARTVVFVTHSLPEAAYLSDRVGVMSARPGRLTDVIEVPMPKPRDPSHRSGPDFHDVVDTLRGIINHHSTNREMAS